MVEFRQIASCEIATGKHFYFSFFTLQHTHLSIPLLHFIDFYRTFRIQLHREMRYIHCRGLKVIGFIAIAKRNDDIEFFFFLKMISFRR